MPLMRPFGRCFGFPASNGMFLRLSIDIFKLLSYSQIGGPVTTQKYNFSTDIACKYNSVTEIACN